jgi:rare lipoprotein A
LLIVFGLAAVTHGVRTASAGDGGVGPVVHSVKPQPAAKPQLDRTGHRRVGTASFYAKKFAGRKMADGTPMLPQGDNAASKTLPLGTRAKVTHLATGRSAIVTIRDRGPYVEGRIVDLSPSTAQKIGLTTKEGLAKVEVAPLEIPLEDGSIKTVVANADEPQRRRAAGGWDN